MDNNSSIYRCRVCGLFQGEDHPPWGKDGKCPSFDICVCCGTEFGYDDCFPEDIKQTRKEWISKGAPWSVPAIKPKNWSLDNQLKQIPWEYR